MMVTTGWSVETAGRAGIRLFCWVWGGGADEVSPVILYVAH